MYCLCHEMWECSLQLIDDFEDKRPSNSLMSRISGCSTRNYADVIVIKSITPALEALK